jgi:hypothetical protein
MSPFEKIRDEAQTHVRLTVPAEVAAEIVEAMAGVRAELTQELFAGDRAMEFCGERFAFLGVRAEDTWRLEMYFLDEMEFGPVH